MPYEFYGLSPEEIATDIIRLAETDLPSALEIAAEIREKEANNQL